MESNHNWINLPHKYMTIFHMKSGKDMKNKMIYLKETITKLNSGDASGANVWGRRAKSKNTGA